MPRNMKRKLISTAVSLAAAEAFSIGVQGAEFIRNNPPHVERESWKGKGKRRMSKPS